MLSHNIKDNHKVKTKKLNKTKKTKKPYEGGTTFSKGLKSENKTNSLPVVALQLPMLLQRQRQLYKLPMLQLVRYLSNLCCLLQAAARRCISDVYPDNPNHVQEISLKSLPGSGIPFPIFSSPRNPENPPISPPTFRINKSSRQFVKSTDFLAAKQSCGG